METRKPGKLMESWKARKARKACMMAATIYLVESSEYCCGPAGLEWHVHKNAAENDYF